MEVGAESAPHPPPPRFWRAPKRPRLKLFCEVWFILLFNFRMWTILLLNKLNHKHKFLCFQRSYTYQSL